MLKITEVAEKIKEFADSYEYPGFDYEWRYRGSAELPFTLELSRMHIAADGKKIQRYRKFLVDDILCFREMFLVENLLRDFNSRAEIELNERTKQTNE